MVNNTNSNTLSNSSSDMVTNSNSSIVIKRNLNNTALNLAILYLIASWILANIFCFCLGEAIYSLNFGSKAQYSLVSILAILYFISVYTTKGIIKKFFISIFLTVVFGSINEFINLNKEISIICLSWILISRFYDYFKHGEECHKTVVFNINSIKVIAFLYLAIGDIAFMSEINNLVKFKVTPLGRVAIIFFTIREIWSWGYFFYTEYDEWFNKNKYYIWFAKNMNFFIMPVLLASLTIFYVKMITSVGIILLSHLLVFAMFFAAFRADKLLQFERVAKMVCASTLWFLLIGLRHLP